MQNNLFSTRDEAYHRDQKKVIAGAYSMNSLLEMEDAVDSCSNLLMKRLEGFATADKAFDFGVSEDTSIFNKVASYAETDGRPGSNTMPSTSSASSLSTKSSASSNKALTWTVFLQR